MDGGAQFAEPQALGPWTTLLEFLSYDSRTLKTKMVAQPIPVKEFPHSTRYIPLPAQGAEDPKVISAMAAAHKAANRAARPKSPLTPASPAAARPNSKAASRRAADLPGRAPPPPPLMWTPARDESVELGPPGGLVSDPTARLEKRRHRSPFFPVSTSATPDSPTISPALLSAGPFAPPASLLLEHSGPAKASKKARRAHELALAHASAQAASMGWGQPLASPFARPGSAPPDWGGHFAHTSVFDPSDSAFSPRSIFD